MRVFFLVVAMVLASVSLVRGSERFEQANQDFKGGKFRQAAEVYEELLAEEGPRVSVLNNLGSAYFRIGDYGRAVLSFERALLLSPGDPDLKANLELAQDEAAVYPKAQVGGWKGLLAGLSPDGRASMALLAAALMPVFALVTIRRRGRARWAVPLMLLCAGVMALLPRPMKDVVDPYLRAVVVANPATVRLSPFEAADPRGTLSSGREVEVGQSEKGYTWIETDEGATKGWVQDEELARIVPIEASGG